MPKPVRIKPVQKRHHRLLWLILAAAALLVMLQPVPEKNVLGRKTSEKTAAPELLQQIPQETIAVFNAATNEMMQLTMDDYLLGVVAAEMPAQFELEALKAQAVAARTFAYSHHDNLSTDPATCQAWISDDEQQKRWGKNFDQYRAKISEAVRATAHQVITYQGELIEPLYHASCGGNRTEASENVWGGQRPYLVSVQCEHQNDPNMQLKTTFSLADLGSRLGIDLQTLPAAANSGRKLLNINASSLSNRVLDIIIGGEHFSGTKVRQALGLKSTLFSYSINGDQVTFTTDGYGHGVGLCQYGANHYAVNGHDYYWILQHYYVGTEVTEQ